MGLTTAPDARRTGLLPSRAILNRPAPCASLPAATTHEPSGDQSTLPCPAAPRISIEGASVCVLVPSAVITSNRRFPSCLATTATRRPSRDTAGGSVIESLTGFQISVACGSLNRQSQRPSPPPRADR